MFRSSRITLARALARGLVGSTTSGLSAVLLFCLVSLYATCAFAAGIKTEISARRAGVGQAIIVQLSVSQEDGEPSPENPKLKVNGAAQVQGPSISSQSTVRMHNFSFSSEKSIVARFVVVPEREGKLTIGPGTFQVGGRTLSGESVVVDVVKDPQPSPGQQRRRSVFGPDPFANDPFDDFFNRPARRYQIPEAPPEYQLEDAPDPVAFIRARLSRKNVVVGEPVVLTILAYGAQGDFGELAPTEPALADFLSYRAMDNLQSEPPYQTDIAGTIFVVRKIRQYIIVPLKTGSLTVGSLSTVLHNQGRSYAPRGHAQGVAVVSPALQLKVVEPPEKDRPAGYLVGDVGRYRLEAELSSKQVVQGEFAELVVRIIGEGQTPSKVLLPEQNGVVWEAPSMSGGPEVQDDVLKGTRTLKYAFQLTQTGTLQLGEVTLPYFDHKARKYAVARVDLGSMGVTPAAATPGRDHQADDVAAVPEHTSAAASAVAPMTPRNTALPSPRRTLANYPGWSWWLILLAPGATYMSGLMLQGTSAWTRKRLESRKQTARIDLKSAGEALATGNKNSALQLSERALFEAIESATGLKARGLMRDDLARVLIQRGLSSEQAGRIQACLVQLEAARYGSEQDDPSTLFTEARKLVQELSGKKRKRKS